jgi:hypothetical protein
MNVDMEGRFPPKRSVRKKSERRQREEKERKSKMKREHERERRRRSFLLPITIEWPE